MIPENMSGRSENAGKDHGHVEFMAGCEQAMCSLRQARQQFQHPGQSPGQAWEGREAHPRPLVPPPGPHRCKVQSCPETLGLGGGI